MVKKKIAFVLAVFCATVLLMAVQKPVFLAYYAADAAQASVGEWLGVVWHGLTLDSTVAGYVTALPAVAGPCVAVGGGCPGEYGGGC